MDNNNNNNENNNETDAINYNIKSGNSSVVDVSSDGYMSMSACSTEMSGATSLAYQASMQSSSFASSGGAYVGSLEMNVHPVYENINTFSTENSGSNETDARYAMHSSNVLTNESFESFESIGQKSFEMNLNNMSNGDDKENSVYIISKYALFLPMHLKVFLVT